LLTYQVGAGDMSPSSILQRCCKGRNVRMRNLLDPVFRYLWRRIGEEGRDGVVALEAASLKRITTSAKQSEKDGLCLHQTSPKNSRVYISREAREDSLLPSSTKPLRRCTSQPHRIFFAPFSPRILIPSLLHMQK
jgi:hypothetical protein